MGRSWPSTGVATGIHVGGNMAGEGNPGQKETHLGGIKKYVHDNA